MLLPKQHSPDVQGAVGSSRYGLVLSLSKVLSVLGTSYGGLTPDPGVMQTSNSSNLQMACLGSVVPRAFLKD